MSRLVKYPLESGGYIFIELTETASESGIVKAGRGYTEEAALSFESAINTLSPIANAIISKLDSINKPPDEASVEFGLSMKADANIIVVKGTADANFKINLKWKKDVKDSQSTSH